MHRGTISGSMIAGGCNRMRLMLTRTSVIAPESSTPIKTSPTRKEKPSVQIRTSK